MTKTAAPRPPQYANGYIYILEISSGRVKVGFTANLKTRLATHVGTARAYGATITRTWASPLHKEARPNEKKLITFCRSVKNAEQEGEYFTGVAFDAVVAFAESELSITPVAPGDTDHERRKARERRERALILDRFEERTEFARRRVHAAITAAGVPAEHIRASSWLLDPQIIQVVNRLAAAEQVDPQEIRDAFALDSGDAR